MDQEHSQNRASRPVENDPTDEAARLFDEAAADLDAFRLDKAETHAQRALSLFEEAFGGDHPDVANVLNLFAEVLERRGRHQEAHGLYERSVRIMAIPILAADPEMTLLRLQSIRGLAGARQTIGRYEEAEALLLEALMIAEDAFGPQGRETAYVLNTLGVLHKYQGRFEEATLCYERALRILDSDLGVEEDGPAAIAVLYHNLAGIEHSRGAFSAGETFARKGITLRKEAMGADHPDVAADLAQLGALLEGQGRYEEADAIYREVLSVFEQVYGREHLEIAVNLNNLGSLCHARGRFEEAEPHYREALLIKERLLGPGHPDVAMTLNNLAVLLKSRGRFDEALALHRRALTILDATLSPDHPNTRTCRHNYESCLREIAERV